LRVGQFFLFHSKLIADLQSGIIYWGSTKNSQVTQAEEKMVILYLIVRFFQEVEVVINPPRSFPLYVTVIVLICSGQLEDDWHYLASS
jgi:hypothetical protein